MSESPAVDPNEVMKNLSADAKLIARMLPFGGHVRLRPSAVEALSNPNNPAGLTNLGTLPGGTQVVGVGPGGATFTWGAGGLSMGGPAKDDDEDIEGFTVDANHLRSFFRASGSGRQESRDRVQAALAELALLDLVKTFQDDTEEPRYALTETGLKVQVAIAAVTG